MLLAMNNPSTLEIAAFIGIIGLMLTILLSIYLLFCGTATWIGYQIGCFVSQTRKRASYGVLIGTITSLAIVANWPGVSRWTHAELAQHFFSIVAIGILAGIMRTQKIPDRIQARWNELTAAISSR